MDKFNTLNSRYVNPRYFVGKSVSDSNNQDCGKIQEICIDPTSFSISGVIVKKRLSKEYFVSRDYFENIDESLLSLNSVPIKPNDKVVDHNGKTLGKVSKINLDSANKLESIEIKSRLKSRIVHAEKIVGIGTKITVNLSD